MGKVKLFKKEQQMTTKWTGGTTTQIAIFPYASSYADRSFDWRLSTAVVELEESNFTKLAGFDRYIMVLEGQLELIHKDAHTILLKQFEQDFFKGEWDTVSYGKARDFNLMVREGMKGKLEHYYIDKAQSSIIQHKDVGFVACYCYKGQADIKYEAEHYTLLSEELLLIRDDKAVSLKVSNSIGQPVHLITAFIGE